MKQTVATPCTETERKQLRELVQSASKVIAYYWPMLNFVHHNPLHGLEHLNFDEAVRRGQQLWGGKGYLSCELFRDYVRSGRILPDHISAALKPLALDKKVTLGKSEVTHFELLQAHLLRGISAPADETLEAVINRRSDRLIIESLEKHVSPVLETPAVQDTIKNRILEERQALGRDSTLANWCDRILGTQITQQINKELIKWCEAFLDEGHAGWSMPDREKGFYGVWKFLAGLEWSPCAIRDNKKKLARLPADPVDALYEHLTVLGIPAERWQDYITLQLTALPGWTGFVKWRGDQDEYEWQQAHPIDLAQYLAVRLWYERELVQKTCRKQLGIDGNIGAISTDMQRRPHLYFMKMERTNDKLPASYVEEVDRLYYGSISGRNTKQDKWKALAERYEAELALRHTQSTQKGAALRLINLANALGISPSLMTEADPEELRVLLEWLDAFPESNHGAVWLKAFETGYREQLIDKLSPNVSNLPSGSPDSQRVVRPEAQAVFCIDVRSEPFRRHMEAVGNYETFGFAGFFSVFIRYRAFGKHYETNQFPVIVGAKNMVHERHRTYHGQYVSRHLDRTRLAHSGHKLLHDLKENVITPYVMVESIGWLYIFPFVGKTIFKTFYRNCAAWLRRTFIPPIATILTVDQLTRQEVEEMLAVEQRAIIHSAFEARFGSRGQRICPEWLEILRKWALDEDSFNNRLSNGEDQRFGLIEKEVTAFIRELRCDYKINRDDVLEEVEETIKTGINFDDQALTLENALRIMGMTRNLARLVLFCGHGSSSDNNPFEAALDCGACGGNEGSPNARILASIANKPLVREQLAKNGVSIPHDTFFIAGRHDTTTDEVEIYDLEDIPSTHQNDLSRLVQGLKETAVRNRQERCAKFPDVKTSLTPAKATKLGQERSCDWSQIRPEWGLSGNAAFIIGSRNLSQGINLDGRVFLHSYDYLGDPEGQFLEVLMTAPQVVGQWINMEHYFSTVDTEVYGSGSKIYHNVVGRFGIMSGPQSDLRCGLARQSVMDDQRPFHEPMRLFTLIEASREVISRIIRKHKVLQQYYDNEWVYLVALDPEEKIYYRYIPKQGWEQWRGP
ncbi:MAG: DUF2309 domain-containing protein [Candidatus Anammoxibacter sp.]